MRLPDTEAGNRRGFPTANPVTLGGFCVIDPPGKASNQAVTDNYTVDRTTRPRPTAAVTVMKQAVVTVMKQAVVTVMKQAVVTAMKQAVVTVMK